MKKAYNTLLCGLLLLCAVSCRQPDAVPAEERNELIEQIREINSLNITPDSMHVLLNALWDENAHRMTENEKVVFYNQRGNIYLRIPELEAAETNYLKALYYLKKLNDGNLGRQVAILTNIGVVRANQGNFDEALDIYRQAQALIENDHNKVESLIILHLNRAAIFTIIGEVDLLLYYAQKALDIAAQEGFREQEARALVHIANVFFIYFERFSEAEEYYRQAIPVFIEYNRLRALWMAYFNLASSLFMQDRLEEGLLYAQKTNETAAVIGFPQVGMAVYYERRGTMYVEQGRYADGLAMFYRALALREQMPAVNVMAETQSFIGDTYRRMGNFDTAYYFLDAARRAAQENRQPRVEANVQASIAIIYAARDDMDNFLTAVTAERELRQRLFNEQNFRALHEIQARYETEINRLKIAKKAEEIQYKQRRIAYLFIILSLTAALFVLAVIIFLFQRRRTQKMIQIVKQHELVSKLQKENYLYAEKSEKLLARLRHLLEVEKIYRQTGLTSNDVCRMLGTNRTYLSKIINSIHQKSFQELINSHRIEEVKELFKTQQNEDSEYADYTMQAVAEMVGFNGTSAFYTAFKQVVGITPTEYKRIIEQAKSSEPEFLSESGFTGLKDSQDFSENES